MIEMNFCWGNKTLLSPKGIGDPLPFGKKSWRLLLVSSVVFSLKFFVAILVEVNFFLSCSNLSFEVFYFDSPRILNLSVSIAFELSELILVVFKLFLSGSKGILFTVNLIF